MNSLCPLVTLKPAEQRPPVEKIGCAPFSRVVNAPWVRCMRTESPMPSASCVIRDQSEAETVLSACTTTSFFV